MSDEHTPTLRNIAADRDWWSADAGRHYHELADWRRCRGVSVVWLRASPHPIISQGSQASLGKAEEQAMNATTSPIYRWRVGEVEITRVLEFEAALFEPAIIHPEASPEIIARHRPW